MMKDGFLWFIVNEVDYSVNNCWNYRKILSIDLIRFCVSTLEGESRGQTKLEGGWESAGQN